MAIVSERISGFDEATALKPTDLLIIAKDSGTSTPRYESNNKLTLATLAKFILSKLKIVTGNYNSANGTKICTITNDADSVDIYAPNGSGISSAESAELIKACYPIGSVYVSLNAACPFQGIGGMSWTSIGAGCCLQGAKTGQTPGTLVEAGLPDISIVDPGHAHTAGTSNYTKLDHTTHNHGYQAYPGKTSKDVTGITLKKSDIYGKSDTVQPPAILVYFFKRTA